MKLADLVDQAAAIEAALRDAAAATISGDALAGALSRGARVRLIIDFGGRPRLRVKLVSRGGGCWLVDSAGRLAPPP
jgi:hypothetical protein